MISIAVIDDDIHIGNMLEETLAKAGYNVIRAYSGTEAVYLLSEKQPDLVLLDLMLPGLSGEELLPKIKGIPVIILSAKIDPLNKAALLYDGAADYMTKPFHPQELLARISVQLRKRAEQKESRALRFHDLTLDTYTYQAFVGEQAVHVTKTEYAILKLLMQNENRVMTKSFLLDALSLTTPDCVESSLKVHIANLRKKLRDAGGKTYIEAVWGIGFKLRND